MKQRVVTGVMVAVFFVVAVLWMPLKVALPFLLLLCAGAAHEFYALLQAANIPNFRILGTLAGLGLILATWVGWPTDEGALAVVLALTTLAVFLRQFPQQHNPRPLETVAGTLLGFIYVAFLLNFVTLLLLHWGDQAGRLLLLYMIVVVKLTDAGAYFIGSACGRHKLVPRISPAKTWEGAVGGVLTGTLASVGFWWITGGQLGSVRLGPGDAVGLGLTLTVAGTIGDLVESLFKRAAGLKDSGRLLRGMGGILDVLDSLLFTAPMLYLYVRFFCEQGPGR